MMSVKGLTLRHEVRHKDLLRLRLKMFVLTLDLLIAAASHGQVLDQVLFT